MRLKTNLASRRYVNIKAVNLALLLLFLLAGVALSVQVVEFAGNSEELGRLSRLSASGAGRGAAGPAVSEAQYQKLMEKIRFANETLEKKSLDWVGILDQLETAVPEGVALNDIAPDLKKGELRLGGMGRSFTDVQAFVENLEGSRYFSEVYLLSHQEKKVGLTQQGVAFALSCKVPLP